MHPKNLLYFFDKNMEKIAKKCIINNIEYQE